MFRAKDRDRTQAEPAAEIQKPDEQWKHDLTREQYSVLRKGRTEQPFTGALLRNKETGSYCCAGCGAELFRSDAKFDSGTGWPSFFEPGQHANIELHEDRSLGMTRTEVTCGTCGGHLGHVFPDGPAPTGMRYCINSCALELDSQ